MATTHHLFLFLSALSLCFSFANCVCGPPSDSSENDYPQQVYTQPYVPIETPDVSSLTRNSVSCSTTTDNSESSSNTDDNTSSNITLLYGISGGVFVVVSVVAGCYFIWLHKKNSAEAVAATANAMYNQYPGQGGKVSMNVGPEKQFTAAVNMNMNPGHVITPQSV